MAISKSKIRNSHSETRPRERLSDVAYQRILEGLFEKRVPAGAFVSQNELVEMLGIPVAPLRDALRVLQAEGVLTVHPRSGIQFIKPDLELTRSTFQFRNIVESAAVKVFAETADDAVLAQLAKRHKDVADSILNKGLTVEAVEELERLENELHGAVISSLNNPLIDSSYRRMHNYLRLLRLDRKLTAPLAMRTLNEHIEIVNACVARDPVAAEIALKAHFSAAMQRSLGLF